MLARLIDWAERGLISDALLRIGIRGLCRARLRQEHLADPEAEQAQINQRLEALSDSAIALDTEAANQQHYEVPAEFFQRVLGPHLKYSACYWPAGISDLASAETAMLELTALRAELDAGQSILDLGCGWGSLSLWAAARWPTSKIVAVSNSATQRAYIETQAKSRGLSNLQVITADVNEFTADRQFDRIVSVEMFEHVRNYRQLMQRISHWLKPDGKLFVHIFCHRRLLYPFETEGDDNWMGRHFFSGGLMPAAHTLLYFQQHLALEQQWLLSGQHYQNTAEAWLTSLDRHRAQLIELGLSHYGPDQAARWLQRWRIFFLAVSELFGYRDGAEWMVTHCRFCRSAR